MLKITWNELDRFEKKDPEPKPFVILNLLDSTFREVLNRRGDRYTFRQLFLDSLYEFIDECLSSLRLKKSPNNSSKILEIGYRNN